MRRSTRRWLSALTRTGLIVALFAVGVLSIARSNEHVARSFPGLAQDAARHPSPDPLAGSLDASPDADVARLPVRLTRLLRAHDCSVSGFGPRTVPVSAIVDRADRFELVPFDDAWNSFTHRSAGTMVAVCRDRA